MEILGGIMLSIAEVEARQDAAVLLFDSYARTEVGEWNFDGSLLRARNYIINHKKVTWGTVGERSNLYSYFVTTPQEVIQFAMDQMAPERSEMEISLHGSMRRALRHLSDGNLTQSQYSTTAAFFAMEDTDVEDKYCVTNEHPLDTHGSATCECLTVDECGCDIDPNLTSVCENCQKCMDCCDSCFTCDGCNKRMGVVDRCGARRTRGDCDSCRGCCDEHYTCNGCGRRSADSCGECESCDSCCNCFYCDICGRSHSYDDRSRCEECDNCTERCNCASDHDADDRVRFVDFYKNPLMFHDAGRKEFKINPLKRHISCEIECDNADNPQNNKDLILAVNKWQDSVVEDGSLEGGHAHEINTQPTNGDAFIQHIKDICDGYAQVEASTSSDCGLHVHVDTRDFRFYDVRRLILTYAKVEMALFHLCHRSRFNNHYSQICGHNYVNMSSDTQLFRRQILGGFYGGDNTLLPKHGKLVVKENKAEKYTQIRYRALNVHSHFHRQSIEFRHHEGTVDGQEITNWALIVANVVQTAYESSEAKLSALPDDPRLALMAMLPVSLHAHCTNKWAVWDANPGHPMQDVTTSLLPTEEPGPQHQRVGRNGKKRCRVVSCRQCRADAEEAAYIAQRNAQMAARRMPRARDVFGRLLGTYETSWCPENDCESCQDEAWEENARRGVPMPTFIGMDFSAIENRGVDELDSVSYSNE